MPEIDVRIVFDKVDADVNGADVLEIIGWTLGVSALTDQDIDMSRIKVKAVKAVPRYDRDSIEKLIVSGRERKGLGWSAMAEQLNGRGVPTMGGGKQWYPSTIKAVYDRASKGRTS